MRGVCVGRRVPFGAAFKPLAGQQRYPRGSVLDRFFEAPEVAKLAIVFPVLEEIELTYGRIRDKESESVPAGFHINAGFAMAGEGKGGRAGVVLHGRRRPRSPGDPPRPASVGRLRSRRDSGAAGAPGQQLLGRRGPEALGRVTKQTVCFVALLGSVTKQTVCFVTPRRGRGGFSLEA